MEEYQQLILEPSPVEKAGSLKEWVTLGDPMFSLEDQFIRRRLQMRGYLKDLAELIGLNTN